MSIKWLIDKLIDFKSILTKELGNHVHSSYIFLLVCWFVLFCFVLLLFRFSFLFFCCLLVWGIFFYMVLSNMNNF